MMPGDDGYGYPSSRHPGRESFTIVVVLGFIVLVLGAAVWVLIEAGR